MPVFDLEPPIPGDVSFAIGGEFAGLLPVIAPPAFEPGEVAVAVPVYAVEEIRCEGAAGVWALVYQGKVLQESDASISLRLSRRIGFRYHRDYEGVDNSDWWCIPKKRFCYSEVEFSDWGGSRRAESVVAFARQRVFPVSAGLEQSLFERISAQCP